MTATKYIVTKLLLKWPLTHITVALTGINTLIQYVTNVQYVTHDMLTPLPRRQDLTVI